jgi:hypothetical protein
MRTFGEVGFPENLWPTPELYLDRLAAYVPQLREHHRPRRYWPTRHGRSLIQSMVGAELELDIHVARVSWSRSSDSSNMVDAATPVAVTTGMAQRISPDALRVKRYAAPAESEAPRSRCEITVVMPSPRMLTPYNASATSIVAF